MKRSIFTKFLDKVEDFPMWLKQIIFIRLSEDIKSHVCEKFIKENADDIFSLYIPILTFKGHEELKNRVCGLDLNVYNFLDYCEQGAQISDISLNMFLSMEEASKYFIFCLEQGYIENPEKIEIEAMAGFLSGKFRTGEYFAQKGIITDEQLEKAVSISSNSQKKFAEILVDLGFIKQEDVSAILTYKEEAQKRFVLDYNVVPKLQSGFSDRDEMYKQQISDLKQENERLKQKLSRLLEIVRNYD